MTKKLNVNDLPLATRQKLGLRKARVQQFSKEQVRSRAIRLLAGVADLTIEQRRRVLAHALMVNKI